MNSTPTESFTRYRGDGSSPSGDTTSSREAHGRYLAAPRLAIAVNTALALEQPLLVTGEPGTGKTALAWSVAHELGLGPVLEFHTSTDSQARDTLYTFDHMARFYDAQTMNNRAAEPSRYVFRQALGKALLAQTPRVVLIDEIDKASRDFPNDLLNVLDRMEFTVHETGEFVRAIHRPIVIITSNSERQLPDPFLRRCVFHFIEFPTAGHLRAILQERIGHLALPERLLNLAVARFLEFRNQAAIEKLPSTAELISWVRVLGRAGVNVSQLEGTPLGELPMLGALIKTQSDLMRLTMLRSSPA